MALEQAAVLFAVATWYFLRFLSRRGTRGCVPDLDRVYVQSPREMRDGR